MLNLIMMFNDDEWNVQEGEEGKSSMPLSRYLEYTNESISVMFREVNERVLRELKDIPCLFMTEFEYERNLNGDSRATSTIRVAKIKEIKVNGKDLEYDFKLIKDFGKVKVGKYNEIGDRLFFHLFETTRTHWAIKEIDIKDALSVFDLDSDGIDSSETGTRAEPEPFEPIITTVEDFLRKVNSIQAEEGQEIFYRGHSNYRYKLEPSLFREENAVPLYKNKERNMINEILTAHPAEFYQDQFMIDKLVRMQHYGLPTRLLDVTANPLVALYFCCADMLDKSTDETIGDVKIFSVNTDDIKFYNSDTVSCITNLSMLDIAERNKLMLESESSISYDDNEKTEMKKLLHFIRAEKPYFENSICISDLSRILFVRGRIANQRILSQSGAFLLFGHEAVLPDTGQSTLKVQRIFVKNKKAILDELSKLNIKPSTIYPGIEETAKEIARRIKGEEIINKI